MNEEPMDIVLIENERGTTDNAHILTETEKRQMERSREYRRRYRERQKDKDKELQQRIGELKIELQQAQLEKADLITQSHALAALSSYSTSMVEALSTAASTSAAMARSLGGQAIDGVTSVQLWAQNYWLMMPTAAELIAGTAWTPTDNQVKWFLKALHSEQIFANNRTFLNHITHILEEGKASPEAQKKSELKVDFAINNWVSFVVHHLLSKITIFNAHNLAFISCSAVAIFFCMKKSQRCWRRSSVSII